MSLFDKLKNKRSSLQEKKDDTTGRGKKPIKVNLKNLVDKAKKNPLNKNLGVKITDTDTNTIKQSEISKQAKKFTKKINKKNINRPEGVIGDTYVSTDKKGNIRSAKKVNPTLKKTVSQVKGDIEFKQSLKKAGASGDISDTAPKKIRDYVTKKRETRASKLGLKDPFKVDTSKAAKENQKIFKNIGTGSKGKPLAKGIFGKGDTKGQMNVKGMDKKAFKITQPKDVKLPQSSRNFDRIKKEYRADAARTSSTTGPRKITKKFTPTVGVKQAEVSKNQKEFTKAIDKARTKTPVTSSKTFSKFAKEAEVAQNKYRANVQKTFDNKSLSGSKKAELSRIEMAKSRKAAELGKGYKLASQGKGNLTGGIVKSSNLDVVKGTTPPKPQPFTGVTAKGNPSRAISPSFKIGSQATIKDIAKQKGALKLPKNYKYYAGAKKIAAKSPFAKKAIVGAGKILGKLGTKGRIAAAGLTLAASNPGVRNFIGKTALASAAAGALGLAKPNKKVLKVGDGLTKVSNMPSKYQPKGMKSGTFKEPGSNKVRGTGDVRVRFDLASGGGRVRNPKDVARVKNIQKNYIDDYNKKAAKNPLKKQIKYSVNKDGSYTVTPPKKK